MQWGLSLPWHTYNVCPTSDHLVGTQDERGQQLGRGLCSRWVQTNPVLWMLADLMVSQSICPWFQLLYILRFVCVVTADFKTCILVVFIWFKLVDSWSVDVSKFAVYSPKLLEVDSWTFVAFFSIFTFQKKCQCLRVHMERGSPAALTGLSPKNDWFVNPNLCCSGLRWASWWACVWAWHLGGYLVDLVPSGWEWEVSTWITWLYWITWISSDRLSEIFCLSKMFW